MAKAYKFKGLLTQGGWMSPAYVYLDDNGRITHLSAIPQTEIHYEYVRGYALPGFQNAHSHAFQYVMAGLAESHQREDDFWSWRDLMYRVALTIDPDQMEAIAAMAYAEMVRHGYSHVAEFHYLHHDKNGETYSNRCEMGERLLSAANKAGIKMTLIPIFYQKGGFDSTARSDQRRFISKTVDHYLELLSESKRFTEASESANYAMGIHSLRAVDHQDIVECFEHRDSQLPLHMHIAEQTKEVEDCLGHLKARPVDWLCDNCQVDEYVHLVHATHITETEIKKLTSHQANVVLCPSTEANLGDGIFPLMSFQANAGKWCIGTDSHIGVSPLEELRLLDYGQRLTHRSRNIFKNPSLGQPGLSIIEMTYNIGQQAMNNASTDLFEIGKAFDAVIYDANWPLLASTSLENLLPTIVYSADSSAAMGTIINGQWVVERNQHVNMASIQNNFTKVIRALDIR